MKLPTLLALLVVPLGPAAWADDAGSERADGGVVPPRLTTPSVAPWPVDAGLDQGGEVELHLTIDQGGSVVDVTVVSSAGPAFTDSAVTAAAGLRFEPARQNGQPVSAIIEYRYRFTVPEAPDGGNKLPLLRLKGQIFTKGTRDPIPLAQLLLASGDVVEADADGRFSIELPPGLQRIEVSAGGHQKRLFQENVVADRQVEVEYRLERTARVWETVVRGQADRAELSRMTLSGAELHEVAGTAGEPLRVIMLLPGVVTPVSGLSYPVVRGSLPAATGLYLDGVRIPQMYHLMVGSSVIHPDFIESIDFFPANAPTRFGRVSGGVINAEVAKPRDDRVHATVSPDLLKTDAFVEMPFASTGTNVTLAGHLSYAAWILGLLSAVGTFGSSRPVFESWDYQGRVEQRLGAGNVRLLAFGSLDLVGARQTEAHNPSVFLTSRFHRIDLRGQVPLGSGAVEAGATVGWETFGLYGEQEGKRAGSFLLNRMVAAARAHYRIELGTHWQLKFGADLERQGSDVETSTGIGVGGGGDILRQPRALGTFSGAFVEAAHFGERLTVVGGARLDTWHLAPRLTLVSAEPKLEVRYQALPSLRLLGSAGLAHQAPMLLISLPVSDVAALGTGLQRVGQFSLGVHTTLPSNLELTGQLFLNHIFQARERSLTEFVTGISSLDDRFSGNRFGRAYGLELMLRLPQQGRLFGWLTYSLMRSERLRRFAVYNQDQSQVTDTTAMVPFAFDQSHTLNLAMGYQLPYGFRVSATLHLHTGRPESGEFSSRTHRLVEDGEAGLRLWSPLPLNQVERLPPFARLDFRVSKTVALNKLSVELFLDVFNVLVRPEVYGYTYDYGDDGRSPVRTAQGAPIILPTLGLKVVY